MLLRLVTVISLIQFLLLMVSGASINIALYRGLLVFLILFSVVYISVFLLNIIKDNTTAPNKTAATDRNESQTINNEQ